MFHALPAWRRRIPAWLLALTLAPLAALVLRAQAPGGGGAGALVPMTASSIARNPDAHVGERVSMMATVEAVVSKTAFTMDQDRTKSTGQEVLVIAPGLTTAPEKNVYLTVQGEVMKFDPAELAKKAPTYTLDLPADVVAKFRGKPCVLATAVVTDKLVDLEKKPIAPMTPEEVVFKGYMTTINPTFTALRGGLDQPNAAQVKEQIATLTRNMVDVAAFFNSRGAADAVKLAQDFQTGLTAADQSATAGKWDEVKTTVGNLQQICTTCHTAHRERVDDGTYRIKSGG